MSLDTLSAATGIPRVSLHRYGKGKIRVPLLALEKLVKGLNCQFHDVIPRE